MIIEPKHHQGMMPFFVYGTLMLGESNDRCWHDLVDRVEQGLVVAGYQLAVNAPAGYRGMFPYAIPDPDPDHYVIGELLWPSSDEAAGAMTEIFDRLEGHPRHYVRTEVQVLRNAREKVPGWMYVMAQVQFRSQLTKIGSSWRVHCKFNPVGEIAGSWDYAGI